MAVNVDDAGVVASPASAVYAYYFTVGGDMIVYTNGTPRTIFTYAAATNYQLATVLGGYDANGVPWRAGELAASYLYGASLYILGGVFTYWTLIWRSALLNTTPLHAVFVNYGANGTIDQFRVPDVDLSAVLQPTALSTMTAANGTLLPAITPEVGGPWTTRTGTFDIQTNRANLSATSGGRDVATVGTGIADVLADVVIRKTDGADTGEFGLCLRYSDDNNYWMVVADLAANQLRIIERNGGVETVRANAAVVLTHTTDYTIRAIAYGQTIDAFLDGGNKITYALAALNENATIHGLAGDEVGETWDNFAVYPRTSAVYDSEFGGV